MNESPSKGLLLHGKKEGPAKLVATFWNRSHRGSVRRKVSVV